MQNIKMVKNRLFWYFSRKTFVRYFLILEIKELLKSEFKMIFLNISIKVLKFCIKFGALKAY